MSSDGQPLHMPAQMQGLDRKELMPSGMNTTATHPGMTHPTGVMHQHNPHAALQSDPARTAMHDGSMYAQGATGEPYEAGTGHKPSVGQRIKEALPGTKEHKAKKESEDNLAVYS